MTHRSHNFSAGPSPLPLPVLERVREELLDFGSTGTSILEMSHRSAAYDRVHNEAIEALSALLGLTGDHSVLFMGGGARTQFALLAMNLIPESGHADYVSTGKWSEIALAEAGKVADVREVWSSKDSGHDHVPAEGAFPASEGAAYLHLTSNNTIFGTETLVDPDTGATPLVSDMSSDLLSRPVDVARYGCLYAGAQKNIGPAGVTVVILRNDLLERARTGLPDILSYRSLATKNSLLNTPPTFPIYVVGLVARHLLDLGGLAAAEARARDKAGLLYDVIDGSGGFYRGHAQRDSRSRMNVTFRAPTEALEARFVEESVAAGMGGLKGHRSVGGLRASIYNNVPTDSVRALAEFMADFQRRNG